MFISFAEDTTGGLEFACASFSEEPSTVGTRRARLLPRLKDIPIPERVQVEPSLWGEQMIEMADHIGPYHTLLIHDRFGGQMLHIPFEERRSPVRALLEHELSHVFTDIYGGQRLQFAAAKRALERARRAGVLASVRAGVISAGDATVVLGTSRTYLSHLINATDEGVGVEPIALPLPRENALLLNAVRLVREALSERDAGQLIAGLADRILRLGREGSDALRAAAANEPPLDTEDN